MKKIFWLILTFQSGASAISFWTGHREAMLANGGFTNTCSPSQFMQNPAGVFCEDSKEKTESFGSSGITSLQSDIQGKSMKDLQGTKAQMGPGLSLFSQTFHETDLAWGFSASISQIDFQKYFELTNVQSPGTSKHLIRQNEASLGLYLSSRTQNIYWGVVFNLMQRESRNTDVIKYKADTAYYLQTTQSASMEHSLGLRLGAIWDLDEYKYSLVLKPRSYSLKGSVRRETTLAGGNNIFNEDTKEGSVKTSDPWFLSLALEHKFASEDKFFFDVGWKSSERKDMDLMDRQSSAAGLTTGLGYEKKWNDRLALLGGFRWTQTFDENTDESKIKTILITSGVVRKFKTVELGTTLGYFSQNSSAYDKDASSFSPSNRFTGFDIAFSSTFSY